MTRKTRTTSEAEIRALVAEGLNWPQCAERLGVNVSLLRNAASFLGIEGAGKRGSTSGLDDNERSKAVAMLGSGLTMEEAAKTLNVRCGTLRASLERHKLPTTCRAAIIAKRAAEFKGVDIDAVHKANPVNLTDIP